MAGNYNRAMIQAALAAAEPEHSFYLDLQSGDVVKVPDADPSPEAEALRNAVMDGYGDRFRYIPGGYAAPGDADVQSWLEAEGL